MPTKVSVPTIAELRTLLNPGSSEASTDTVCPSYFALKDSGVAAAGGAGGGREGGPLGLEGIGATPGHRPAAHQGTGSPGREDRPGCREAAGQRAPGVDQARAKSAKLAPNGVSDAAAGRRRGQPPRAVNDMTELLEATRRIAAQTRNPSTPVRHLPPAPAGRSACTTRDARPIARGRCVSLSSRSWGPGHGQRRRGHPGPHAGPREPL